MGDPKFLYHTKLELKNKVTPNPFMHFIHSRTESKCHPQASHKEGNGHENPLNHKVKQNKRHKMEVLRQQRGHTLNLAKIL